MTSNDDDALNMTDDQDHEVSMEVSTVVKICYLFRKTRS
jgi:hypothetical protein